MLTQNYAPTIEEEKLSFWNSFGDTVPESIIQAAWDRENSNRDDEEDFRAEKLRMEREGV